MDIQGRRTKVRIIRTLAEGAAMRTKKIADAVGLSLRAVNKQLIELEKMGAIETEPDEHNPKVNIHVLKDLSAFKDIYHDLAIDDFTDIGVFRKYRAAVILANVLAENESKSPITTTHFVDIVNELVSIGILPIYSVQSLMKLNKSTREWAKARVKGDRQEAWHARNEYGKAIDDLRKEIRMADFRMVHFLKVKGMGEPDDLMTVLLGGGAE